MPYCVTTSTPRTLTSILQRRCKPKSGCRGDNCCTNISRVLDLRFAENGFMAISASPLAKCLRIQARRYCAILCPFSILLTKIIAFGIVQSAERSGIGILDSREVVDALNLAHSLILGRSTYSLYSSVRSGRRWRVLIIQQHSVLTKYTKKSRHLIFG